MFQKHRNPARDGVRQRSSTHVQEVSANIATRLSAQDYFAIDRRRADLAEQLSVVVDLIEDATAAGLPLTPLAGKIVAVIADAAAELRGGRP